MNYSTAVMLINPSIRAVMGQYEEDGVPETFKTLDQSLKVGDFATVESTTRWGYTTVKITKVDVEIDFDSGRKILWVVQKMDNENHNKIIEMETAAIEFIKKGELRRRREEIKKNTLDAVSAGEIDKLDIVRLGGNVLEDGTKKAAV